MFELWDAELGISLGLFQSEAEALAAVRKLCEQSAGSRATGADPESAPVVATRDALRPRVQSRLTPYIGLFSG